MSLLPRSKMHPYQNRMVAAGAALEGVGYFMEPGLGKTVTSATMILDSAPGTTLVVAPKNVAEGVWRQELAAWEHLAHLRVSLVLGTPKEREKAILTPADYYVINNENFVWYTELDFMPLCDNLIIDESSNWKDHTSKRFKALKPLLRGFRKRVIADGTPSPEGYGDLWTQLGVVDLGERLEKTITKFREIYMMPTVTNRHTGQIYKYGIRPGMDKVIHEKIQDVCFSLRAEDYLTLPALSRVERRIPLPLVHKTAYEQLQKKAVLELGDEAVTAATAGAKAGKLMQFTAGSVRAQAAVEGEKGPWVEVHDLKLQALKSICEESSEPTIIFYWFKESLRRIKELYPDAVEFSVDRLPEWRVGKIKKMLLHPLSGGVGVNAQCNECRLVEMIWFDLPWSSRLFTQSIARVMRQGQTRPVQMHLLVLEGTIDEHAVEVVDGKISTQDGLMSALGLH